jgi:ATP-binding cassette, subfamily G (WHITE), member 1
MELYRFFKFLFICLLAAFNAQGLGTVVGSIFNVKYGATIGCFFIFPFLIYSGFFIKISEVNESMHWLFHISFFKYAFDGAMQAIYGYNRKKLNCNAIYCHFVDPKYFKKFIEMPSCSYQTAVFAWIDFVIIFRLIAFFIIKFRLKN